jgi:hypothetical protein
MVLQDPGSDIGQDTIDLLDTQSPSLPSPQYEPEEPALSPHRAPAILRSDMSNTTGVTRTETSTQSDRDAQAFLHEHLLFFLQ